MFARVNTIHDPRLFAAPQLDGAAGIRLIFALLVSLFHIAFGFVFFFSPLQFQ